MAVGVSVVHTAARGESEDDWPVVSDAAATAADGDESGGGPNMHATPAGESEGEGEVLGHSICIG